ncbi:Aldo/keto reductase [Amylocystis lapponica]|nr:Aldo/keto reductase [Amylocystis lapponica]
MPRLGFGVYQNYSTTESVLEAFKAGYRLVDTAQAYKSEAHVGAAVTLSGLDREDVFIVTKCISKTHGYESTLRGVDASLQKLAFDYIDLFLIHDPFSGSQRRLETYRALQDARRAGKIRSVGCRTCNGVHHLEEIKAAGLEMPSVNQIELHPFCQQRSIVDYCRAHSIVVQAYSPLLRGTTDRAPVVALAAKARLPQALSVSTHGALIAASQHHCTPAHVLLRWSLQKGFVPLPKSATPERIRANTQLYAFALDDGDMARLDALDRGGDGALTWNPVDVV